MDKAELEQAINEAVRSQAKHDSPRIRPNGNSVHDHLLSIVLFGLFLLSLIAQYYFQFQHELNEASHHGQPPPGALSGEYLFSFAASVFENWQREFLQVVSFVVLATYFIHRGSPQSRDNSDQMAEDFKAIREKLGA